LASTADYMRAAQTSPSKRTEAQRQMVQTAYEQNMVDVKNADHATQERVKTYGDK